MVSFRKPRIKYDFDVKEQIRLLNKHKRKRSVPINRRPTLTLCTWNIANLGLQDRADDHYKLIAHIIKWFDVIAIQEVHDNLEGLFRLAEFVGSKYELIFSDRGGNDERAAFFFNRRKVKRLAMTAELAVPQKELKDIKLKTITSKFKGFDRNPFIATFQFNEFRFMLINAHSFFGSKSKPHQERRILETYAIARYADLRRRDKHVFVPNIIALGDFNIPKAQKGDAIYEALVSRGLMLPEHSTQIASSISTDNYYDQISFFPSIKKTIKSHGVFDYDGALFEDLYNNWTTTQFNEYCRYYISDHRPMWIELDLG